MTLYAPVTSQLLVELTRTRDHTVLLDEKGQGVKDHRDFEETANRLAGLVSAVLTATASAPVMDEVRRPRIDVGTDSRVTSFLGQSSSYLREHAADLMSNKNRLSAYDATETNTALSMLRRLYERIMDALDKDAIEALREASARGPVHLTQVIASIVVIVNEPTPEASTDKKIPRQSAGD